MGGKDHGAHSEEHFRYGVRRGGEKHYIFTSCTDLIYIYVYALLAPNHCGLDTYIFFTLRFWCFIEICSA